jgi:hypothetical protein
MLSEEKGVRTPIPVEGLGIAHITLRGDWLQIEWTARDENGAERMDDRLPLKLVQAIARQLPDGVTSKIVSFDSEGLLAELRSLVVFYQQAGGKCPPAIERFGKWLAEHEGEINVRG